jgi:4-hydroxy-tetrahydrodipicolinate synthase
MIRLEGSFAAVVTPFKNGEVDLARLKELVDFHLKGGTHGICPVGTTGESPTVTKEEKAQIIKTVVKMARGKMVVMPGTGTNDTRSTIELTRMAKELGADAALLVTPYYNKPTQEGLFRHFEAAAKAVAIPQVLYNVPGRTAVNLLPETLARLSKIRNVAGVKEASGSLEQVTQIRTLCDIAVLSGDDALTYPMMCLGGHGVISVAANIIPKAVVELCESVRNGRHARAEEIHLKHYELFKALFLETNPIPVKTAMKMMGMLNGEFRLPLCEMSDAGAEKLKKVLASYELI